MELVKKNIASILCGVVVILALVALYWPISGWVNKLQTSVNNSKKNYADKIQSLMSAPRKLPITNALDANADQPMLKQFPTEQVIKLGEEVKDQVQKQSQEMLAETVKRNRHEPILPMSVTHPPDPFQFQRAYLQYLGVWPPDDPKQQTIKTVLDSVTPPNDREIKAEEGRMWNDDFDKKLIVINGIATNKLQIDAQFNQAKEKLPEKMRRERAEKYKIYLDPDAIDVAGSLGPDITKQATPEQIWYAQNMLWIDQDICSAISQINAKANNIMDAPIKQLLKISIPDDDKQYITLSNSGAPTTGDSAVTLTDDMIAGKAFNLSETGRISNPKYDVIHFRVEMNVDARKVPEIVAQLQRGRLITVFTCDTNAVDARAAVDQGYVYGEAPVVNLKLMCEELFMRGWTVGNDPTKDALMPVAVEQLLNIVNPAGAQ